LCIQPPCIPLPLLASNDPSPSTSSTASTSTSLPVPVPNPAIVDQGSVASPADSSNSSSSIGTVMFSHGSNVNSPINNFHQSPYDLRRKSPTHCDSSNGSNSSIYGTGTACIPVAAPVSLEGAPYESHITTATTASSSSSSCPNYSNGNAAAGAGSGGNNPGPSGSGGNFVSSNLPARKRPRRSTYSSLECESIAFFLSHTTYYARRSVNQYII